MKPAKITAIAVGGPKDGQSLTLLKPTGSRGENWTLDVRRDENGEPLYVDGYIYDAARGELRYTDSVDLETMEPVV